MGWQPTQEEMIGDLMGLNEIYKVDLEKAEASNRLRGELLAKCYDLLKNDLFAQKYHLELLERVKNELAK